jgi:hypothetical protein
MFLTPQQTMARTVITTSLQSTKVNMEDSIQTTQNNDRNKMAVDLTIADHLIGNSNENVVWKDIALGANIIHNNTTSPSKAAVGSLLTNRSNCTTLSATSPSKAAVGSLLRNSTYNLRVDVKTYPIIYNVTVNGNKLNTISTQTDNATLLVNITSQSNGTLTIQLPRILIDSKKQANQDNPYEVIENGRSKMSCVQIKSTQQSRTLAIDFVRGTGQISIVGTNIFPSKETPPKAAIDKATIVVNQSSAVILNGSASRDPDGDSLTYAWTQTAGPILTLKGGNKNIATFIAPKVSNETKMSFNLRVKDRANLTDNANETVIVRGVPRPLLSNVTHPTGVNATAAFHAIVDSNLPYFFIAVIASAMVIPLAIDMILAYRKKPKQSTDRESAAGVLGVAGLYRTLMTFGVVLLVGGISFYILILITLNINNFMNPTLQSLIDVFKNLATILGTALATIIAFYFGMRGSETAAEKAAVAVSGYKSDKDGTHSTTLKLDVPGSKVPQGSNVTITGELTDASAGNAGVASKKITFTSPNGSPFPAPVTTSPDGTYTASFPAPNVSKGWKIQAHFAGDNIYNEAHSPVATYNTE